MKARIRRTWATRTSWIGVVSMMTFGILYPLGAVRTEAQLVQLPRIAVVDFINKSGYGGVGIARSATDAVASEFQKTGKYEVLARGEIEQQLRDLDLMFPLDRTGFLRLGRALQTESIVAGEVNAVTFTGSPKQAEVTISIRVIDIASGEPINGAVATGRSNPRPGYAGDDDTLALEAIRNAAYEAVRTVLNTVIPEATVLTTRGGTEVLLNRGVRGGLKPGMVMVVIRRGEEVGRIRVTQVSDSDAVGQIISTTKGIQSEDKARAIFEVPTVKVSKTGKVTAERPSQRTAGSRQALRALGVLLVLGLIAFGVARGSSGGNTPLEYVTAEAGADGNFDPVVRVSWRTNLFGASNRYRVLWHIYRSDLIDVDGNGVRVPAGVVPGDLNFFVDTIQPRTFSYASLPRGTEGSEDLEYEEVEGSPGIAPGRSYTYEVALVYREDRADQQGAPVIVYFLSDRVRSGQVTVIQPVQLLDPFQASEDVDPANVRFSWLAAAGANAYRVQVSTNPTFNNPAQIYTSPEIQSAVAGGAPVSTERIDLSDFLRRLGLEGQRVRLFWRVGARNLADSPGPTRDAQGNRYVWSRPFEFQTQELPPSP